jgi:hypothetical protein
VWCTSPRRSLTPSGPCPDHVLEAVQDQFGAHAGRRAPADDPAGQDVDDESDVAGPGPGRDVGEVGDPLAVRSGRGEVPVDQVPDR